MKKFILLFVFTLLVGAATAFAQPGMPDGSDDAVPVDGGITVLLVGGALYGAKKLKERNNKLK